MRPIVNMPEEDRATDIGNMHKNLVKIALVIPEISWRTDSQTILATALAGEVIMSEQFTPPSKMQCHSVRALGFRSEQNQ